MANAEGHQPDEGLMVVDLAHSADAALVIDTRKRIVFWNEAAERLLGFSAREVIGRACCDVVGLCRVGLECHAASQVQPGQPGSGPGAWMSHEMRTRTGAACRLQMLPYGAWGHNGEYRMAYIFRADHAPSVQGVKGQGVKGADALAGEDSAFVAADLEATLPESAEALYRSEPRVSLSAPSTSGAFQKAAMPDSDSVTSARKANAPDLTRREREVLSLLAIGMTNAEIATTLNISPITARNHVISVIEKLNVHTRLQAVVTAARLGLL